MKVPEIIIVETVHQPGSLAKVLQVIAERGLVIEHLSALRREQGRTLWEITLELDEETDRNLYERIDQLPTARFVGKSDRVFNRHRGGKIRTVASVPINTPQVLRDLYTPGVARVCLAIRKDPALAHEFTARDSTVAIVTNGTAILGLGDIGALAGLPVMEGKAALLADLVGLSGVPLLLAERDPARVVAAVSAVEMSFGAIQLEDFAAPECFEIERQLRARLDKPVLHDDQHGTAVVTLAALLNATRRAGRSLRDSVVGQIGLGAAGTGIVRLLRAYGVQRILGADRNPAAIARVATLGAQGVSLPELMQRADIVVATTGVRDLIRPEWVRAGQVILALSNPDPEIDPLEAQRRGAAFAADGRSINNVLAFPGLFKGALAARARAFSDAMLMAAARTLAERASGEELVPDPLDKSLHEAVARAVATASAAQPQAPIERGEQPQRPDQQELQVPKE
ncbi:MAG TPA: malic enzyme-like NAD(P)-binding protein [Steroidobacteraceae bacterium]|nr:malic enzyme-like NAD(P)-binding protein [Steroidobacteraceae bacterium]